MTEVQKVVRDVRLQEWVNIIREQKASDLYVRAWCKENDIAHGRYYYWLNKLRIRRNKEANFHKYLIYY